jgi:hypothetical protein
MLKKTMKKVLNKKINEWLETITDEDVKKAIEKDLIITGGCFTSMILGEQINDFDCYFRTKESVLKVMQYYIDKWNEKQQSINPNQSIAKVFVLDCDNPSQEILNYYHVDNFDAGRVKLIFPSTGVVGNPINVNINEELGTNNIEELDEIKAEEIIEQEKTKYFPVFISSNAITLSNKIQLIARFYGEPSDIHATYDFMHTKSYYDYISGEITIPNEVYDCTINKTLIYCGSLYPVCSMFRIRKFIARGWNINAGQILKIALQVSDLNLTDIGVLEDQLIGVDSLYFMQLIEQFKKQKENNSEFILTRTYIESIIDKIF